jgi:DNA-binding transcriptional regulator YdaS (Cro superfamily)
MDLKEWLTKKKILQVEFARQIGINPLYLSLILKKKRFAGFDLAETIEKATKGKVKAKDLIRPAKEKIPCPVCGKMYHPENLVEKKGTKGEHP